MSMTPGIRGVTVTVRRPCERGRDRFGNDLPVGWKSEKVHDVLVSPSETEQDEPGREFGHVTRIRLHFPKAYGKPLRGCEVDLPAPWCGRWRVIGSPSPYIGVDTPTRWHMPVDVERADG